LDLFIVKEIKPRYESILSNIPGQQLVGRAYLNTPTPPFFNKHALYSAKGKFERNEDTTMRLQRDPLKKNYKKFKSF